MEIPRKPVRQPYESLQYASYVYVRFIENRLLCLPTVFRFEEQGDQTESSGTAHRSREPGRSAGHVAFRHRGVREEHGDVWNWSE